MKPCRQHPTQALSAVKIRNLTKPGKYADGNGLYLVVDASGAKRWLLRTVVKGKRRDIGLGGLAVVSLANAREDARTYRKTARDGGDPLQDRRKARTPIPTFAECVKEVHAIRLPHWRNPKHGAQWLTTLETYAFPFFGDRSIDQIESGDVLKVLLPIWVTKAETARRVRQRLKAVFDYAKAKGFRSGDNPLEGIGKVLPKQIDQPVHHPSVAYQDVAAFMKALNKQPGIAARALEFTILTAARSGEVRGATWNEIDMDNRTWTIPGKRMKSAKQHRVPLSNAAMDVLRGLPRLGDLVFPGVIDRNPLSDASLTSVMRRMDVDAVPHGFRSTFRDWAAERTNFPRDVCEGALAHVLPDKTEKAYKRTDLFDKRRKLMNAWAAFATSVGADVIAIPRTA